MVSAGGFYNAPITKALTLSTALLTTVLSAAQKDRWALDLPRVLSSGQFHRLVTRHLFFRDTAELLVGCGLLYTFRTFERQMGSRKFGAFCVVATAVATSLEVGALSALSVSRTSPGPYGILYALFILYGAHAPAVRPTVLVAGRLAVSEKSVCYFFGMQLLCSAGAASAVPAAAGLLAGALYHSDALALSAWRVPGFVAGPLAAVFGPLLRGTHPRAGGGGGGGPQQRGADAAAAGPPAGPPPPPSDADVASLRDMGFPTDRCIAALGRTRNNVQLALEELLSGH